MIPGPWIRTEPAHLCRECRRVSWQPSGVCLRCQRGLPPTAA